MHDPSHFELHDLQACQQLAQNTGKNMGAANNSPLAELLLSFLVMYAAACDEWLCASNVGFRWAAVPANAQFSCVTCNCRAVLFI